MKEITELPRKKITGFAYSRQLSTGQETQFSVVRGNVKELKKIHDKMYPSEKFRFVWRKSPTERAE